MNRLIVCVKNAENGQGLISGNASNGANLAAHYAECLEQAGEDKADLISFGSVAQTELTSKNFQNISVLLRAVVTYLREHEYPKAVRICCEDKETATLYRQVYNFYFAETKLQRMEDEGWD